MDLELDLEEDLQKFIDEYYNHYKRFRNANGLPSKDTLKQNLAGNGKLKVDY